MRIVQITPGVMPIPPNGWGAVEKIIWEYKLCLEKLGYQTDILYADDVEKKDGQIVHAHMANLANLLHQRGIEYAFSLHDHHVEHFGKDSDCYRQNYEAIKNSKIAFVHSRHLIDYFDSLPQISYLPHGANLEDYSFSDRSENIRREEPKLFMMASNGIGGNPLSDRKGFLIGIEAAKKLGMSIDIICPESNRAFFDHHRPEYGRLSVHYGLGYAESIELLKTATVFLHPSSLEAGHPNLTIAESLAMGIPVVGTSNIDIKGLVRAERSAESIAEGVKACLLKYDTLVSEMDGYRYLLSWDIIVSKMLRHYKSAFSISEKEQLMHSYSNTSPAFIEKQKKSGISVEFKSNRAFLKTSRFSDGMTAVFKDKRTNRIIFHSSIGKNPGQWAYIYSPEGQFVDWRVEVKQGAEVIHREDLNIKKKRVLIKLSEKKDGIEDEILRFAESAECFITIKSPFRIEVKGCCFDADANEEEFYFTISQSQLADYFAKKERIPDRELIMMASGALGDTIGFMPYAQKWAENKGCAIDTAVNHHRIFDPNKYRNLNIIDKKAVNPYEYTDLHQFEYIFGKPLQKGYSDQFGMEYEEIDPIVRNSGRPRPIKERYVCIGVQTTAQCKYWNYPDGWEKLCKMLIKTGLIPVAVDLHEVFGIEGNWNSLPKSAIKKVGIEFDEVIRYIEHCELFIGVSSGLSWLAHGLGKKVVMISGTTTEDNEFTNNNIRVINKSVCNSCFNKPGLYSFSSADWMWCPVNKGTDRQFECTKKITPEMVFDAIAKNFMKKRQKDEYII